MQLSTSSKKVVGLYDNIDSDTQISVVNFNTDEVTVTAVVRDEAGKELFREDVKMPGLNAMGYFPSDASSETAGKRGSVEFSVPGTTRGGLSVVSTRFYDAGALDNLPSVALP